MNPHDQAVLKMLKEKNSPLSRPDLVQLTGIPRSTLLDALVRLLSRQKIRRFAEPRQSRGRPRIFYEVIT